MHHNDITNNSGNLIIKTSLFMALLIIVGLIYFESKNIVDLVYFSIILGLFLRFLIVKLYH